MARQRANATRVEGLAEFQRALRDAGPEWAKELRTENKAAAAEVVELGRDDLKSGGDPVQRHVAQLPTAIRAKGESRFSVVIVSGVAKRNRMALGAVVGSIAYRQFPEYSEAAWRAGLPTGGYGPYEAIRENVEDIRDGYGDRIAQLQKKAFPD